MKKVILVICGIIIGIIIGGGLVYFLNQGNENLGRNGEYISYYENGQIKEKGNYINGKKDGEYISYYENGQIKNISNYKEDIPVGEFISYYENGQLQLKCEFENLKWSGECILYDEEGNFEGKGELVNGKLNGEFTAYYENGNVAGKGTFGNEILDGEVINYYENGNIKMKGNFENGQPDGELVYFYENGNIDSKGNFKNGQPVGEMVYYHENGKIRAKMNFKDGELDGEYTNYYENGQIEEKTFYKNGKLNGEYIAYHENGELEAKGNYKDGIFDGKYIFNFKDGKITELNFKNGKLDGTQTGYYEDGSIRFSGIYENGIGTKSYFDKDGNLIGTGEETFTDEFDEEKFIYKSRINGLEITYYHNGQTYEISNYKNGELDGIQTLYYENGQIQSVCDYSGGVQIGKCIEYDENGEVNQDLGYYDSGNCDKDTLPDEAIIEVVDTMYENEFVNLEITMMKSGSKMDNYCSYIAINVVDENGNVLDVNEEYALPYNGYYKFVASDLGSKMFQKGLTIKKEGSFYIEVLDMLDPDEKILGRQKVNVIKNDILKNNDYYIDIITPEPGLQYTKGIIDIIAITPEHPNSPAQIYIDGGLPIMLDTDLMGQMYRTIWNIPTGEHTLYIKMVDRDGSIIGESDKIIFYMENK